MTKLSASQFRQDSAVRRLAVENQKRQQRQVAPTVVVAAEERQLLGAMCAVIGRV